MVIKKGRLEFQVSLFPGDQMNGMGMSTGRRKGARQAYITYAYHGPEEVGVGSSSTTNHFDFRDAFCGHFGPSGTAPDLQLGEVGGE